MSREYPLETFLKAFQEAQQYPSQGPRAQHAGVPSRPTLARYSTIEAIEVDPGDGDYLRSANMRVIACIAKLASGSDESVETLRSSAASRTNLQEQARKEVFARHPQVEGAVPKETFDSHMYLFDVLTALSACDYGVDPILAIRKHLEGETLYR